MSFWSGSPLPHGGKTTPTGDAEITVGNAPPSGDPSENASALQDRREAQPWLDAITFDTFGWAMVKNSDEMRIWGADGAFITEMFMDLAPDFESLDVEVIRESMLDAQNALEASDFDLEEFDLPEEVMKSLPPVLPDESELVDVDVRVLMPAKCVLITVRNRSGDRFYYATSIGLLFADCYWLLQIEVPGNSGTADVKGLSRLQSLVGQLLASISFKSQVLDLEGFDPGE